MCTWERDLCIDKFIYNGWTDLSNLMAFAYIVKKLLKFKKLELKLPKKTNLMRSFYKHVTRWTNVEFSFSG